MKTHLEKIGGIGAVVAAAACPVCFPKLALIGAAALAGAAAFAGLYVAGSALLVYAGLAGLVAASSAELWGCFRRRPTSAG